MSRVCADLKSSGVAADSYGGLLSSVLLTKLPSELRLIVSRSTGEREWDLDGVMTELAKELEARERTSVSSHTHQPRRSTRERDQSTASTLLSGGSMPMYCYCQRNHPSSSCGVVTSVEERRKKLREAGRCFICLRRGHLARLCHSKKKCAHCSGRHHDSICSRVAPEPPTKAAPSLNPEAAAFESTASTLCVGATKSVLLPTAQVDVYKSETPQQTLRVRAILDTGSQRSYITSRVKEALTLRKEGERCMAITTFGSVECNVQKCEVVQLCLKTRDGGRLLIEAFVVPVICAPLSIAKYPHLSKLDLADFADESKSLEIDLLVGADYSGELTTGEICQVDGCPIAIGTKLGWVVSGAVPASDQQRAAVSIVASHVMKVESIPQQAEQLDTVLKSFWELESLGIKNQVETILESFA